MAISVAVSVWTGDPTQMKSHRQLMVAERDRQRDKQELAP